jgi:hypothetical protein
MLYQTLAQLVQARLNCIASGNTEWRMNHERKIIALCKAALPSGSGWDLGTRLDLDRSTGERLVLFGQFHHMTDAGVYDGWTEHTITVRPSLAFGFTLTVSGRNRNDIKAYLSDLFNEMLSRPAPEDK